MKIEDYRGPYTVWREPRRYGATIVSVAKYEGGFCYEATAVFGEHEENRMTLARVHGFNNPIDAQAAGADEAKRFGISIESTPPDEPSPYAFA